MYTISFSQVCSLTSWTPDQPAGWREAGHSLIQSRFQLLHYRTNWLLLFMIHMLSEDMGHFFQIWSLPISLHIFCSAQFDAVVCNELSTTNLEFSGEQQTGQNTAAVRTVPLHQYEVLCCPSRWVCYHICNWHQKKTTEVNFLWNFIVEEFFTDFIGQNNLVLHTSTQGGQVYFFFQRCAEE